MKKIAIITLLASTIMFAGFDQIFKTNLKITVRDELGNIVEGAEVRLFETKEDYNKEENQIKDTLVTDKKGDVKFKDLEPRPYYVLATKGDKNNWGAGEVTGKLEEGKMNKVTIVIE